MSTETNETEQTIADFAKKHRITVKPVYIGKRTDKAKSKESKPWQHFLWFCTLERSDAAGKVLATMEQEYRMGLGHIVAKPTPESLKLRPGTIAHEEHMARYGKPKPPTVEELLNSLILDASAAHQTFEDWAAECGYDEDSREAERIYHACNKVGRELMAFLGRDLFNELNTCERL